MADLTEASLLFNSMEFMMSGLVLQSIARGHWTDWTKPQTNTIQKIVLQALSGIMFFYGGRCSSLARLCCSG